MINNQFIHGDSLTILKNLADDSVDCGVTSPPYNKQENKKGWLVKNVIYENAGDKLPEAEYQINQINILNELYRIIKPGGSFFYNHKIRWEIGELIHPIRWISQTNWTIRQEIIWDRIIAANIRGWRFWQIDERIYWLYKPINDKKIGIELASKHAKLTSIWRFAPEGKNDHPAPFPLRLPVRAIASTLQSQNSMVIDPYCGSGTTLIAAKLLGHNFIGIDSSKQYLQNAENRVNTLSDQDKNAFQAEIATHKIIESATDKRLKQKPRGKFAPKDYYEDAKNNSHIQQTNLI